MARKNKGSKNRGKARRQLARTSAEVARQRLDFQHKAARELVATYDRIGVEDLRVKNMMAKGSTGHRRTKAGLNRSIADASWGRFVRVLEHQARKAGAEVVKIRAAYTTQRCSSCGSIAKTRLDLSDRELRCGCGLVLDRDRNAARNLSPDRAYSNPAGLSSGRGVDGSKTRVSAETRAA